MNGIGRLLFAEGVHQEACTGDYKGDTQNLTHVQKHVSFEGNLIIFDKFDEETGAEADHQEDADQQNGGVLEHRPPVAGFVIGQ